VKVFCIRINAFSAGLVETCTSSRPRPFYRKPDSISQVWYYSRTILCVLCSFNVDTCVFSTSLYMLDNTVWFLNAKHFTFGFLHVKIFPFVLHITVSAGVNSKNNT
jgi:hypothetical protein